VYYFISKLTNVHIGCDHYGP